MTNFLVWRKSSYSGQNGDCVELAEYRISTFSGQGGSCVAVAGGDDVVLIRNSNTPDRGTLVLSPTSVAAFVAACSAGQLDDLA